MSSLVSNLSMIVRERDGRQKWSRGREAVPDPVEWIIHIGPVTFSISFISKRVRWEFSPSSASAAVEVIEVYFTMSRDSRRGKTRCCQSLVKGWTVRVKWEMKEGMLDGCVSLLRDVLCVLQCISLGWMEQSINTRMDGCDRVIQTYFYR